MNIKFTFLNCILFLLNITSTNLAQNNHINLPSPKIGWDSLQNKISYLELAARAGIWGAYEVKLEIDATGKMISQNINIANYELEDCKNNLTQNDSLFIKFIKYEFKDLEWIPGSKNGKAITMDITVPLVFYLPNQSESSPTLLVKPMFEKFR